MNMMFFPKFSLSLNFYVLLVLCLCVYAQEPFDRAKCESLVECGSCLQHLGCFWCLRPKLRNTLNTTVLNHCISENNNDIVCSSNDLINPKSISEVIEDRPLQSKSGSIVQMKPQRIRLTLRIGESYNLRFQYSQAENYPVDLYYIIDNSYSMSVHKEKLSKLGTKLAETMRGITNDFRIGFGSFMDKVNLPFTGIEPNQLKNPCPSRKQKCVSPYSFKNHMALSTDFQRFATEIMNAGPSANLDSPEGGFDAIMQTIVCKKEIGWRPQARHLIIFSTDAQFHIAGDGKLAGIIETNDAECHMINNNYDGLYNDYPSVSQLNYVAKENNINLIFATVKTPYGDDKTYRKLSQEVENSKFDRLDEDSRNVIKLVVDNYKKIVNSVTMETNATDNIQVRITPHCKRPIEDGCANIRLGEVVNFTATIKPLKCVAGSDGPTIISVKPNGIDESLIVELETICRCNCESPEHLSYEKNAPVCTNAGDLVCGVCMCNKNRHGSNCECDNEFSLGLNETNCREDKPGAVVCSGLGICKCGKCECKSNPNTGKKYRGKYCDCDDDSCDRENGKLCNERGLARAALAFATLGGLELVVSVRTITEHALEKETAMSVLEREAVTVENVNVTINIQEPTAEFVQLVKSSVLISWIASNVLSSKLESITE
ncbi:hypothetical protein HHI36_017637 [Cryptolaemus montrouzieri]|uniref:Integrin beta n=1 Tax=Cryptolaemus montrouzieri TaxID=559131 RepID=A0ABD2NNH5_9CUCU